MELPCFIQGDGLFLEQQKNEFLAALYEETFHVAGQIYIDIVKHAENLPQLTENDQKAVNQIQTIYNRFKPSLLSHCTQNITKYHLCLKRMILETTKHSGANISHIDFTTWETRLKLTPRQKDLLYKTAMNFQLTTGCSNYCRRCNEWALPGVRSHFSYSAILTILNHMADQGNDEISLYGASDPLDWKEDKKTISDILDHITSLPLGYSLLTKVPKGKAPLLKALLKRRANLSVSITSQNKSRIKRLEQDFGNPITFQHDLDELLIPAGLDEDFTTIKPSITDGYGTEITPEGAFIIIPTFTSALHPSGHIKLPVTSETPFFPEKKTGRQALLVDYFKPLKGYNLIQRVCHLSCLLDGQIETLLLDNGTEPLTPPGMRSLKEYFSIFEEKARLQRKKIGRHTHLCDKETCLSSKLSAASFFLESIVAYMQQNETTVKIVKFLLKDEFDHIFGTYKKKIAGKMVRETFINPDLAFFDIFRCYVFCLLNRYDDRPVLEFIKTHPGSYDPVADMFVPRRPLDEVKQ